MIDAAYIFSQAEAPLSNEERLQIYDRRFARLFGLRYLIALRKLRVAIKKANQFSRSVASEPGKPGAGQGPGGGA